MEDPSGQEHELDELGELRRPLHGRSNSVMRDFIESGYELVWTDEYGKCGPDSNHCAMGKNEYFPFIGKTIFKGKCLIERWEVDSEGAPTFGLKSAFVTKTLQKSSRGKEERTKIEISVMKNLRHPHVAVFLGSWERLERLSILIFPAACFDLADFMKRISDDLEDLRASLAQDPSGVDPTTAVSSKWSMPLGSSHPNVDLPCLQKLLMLRRYFVCLSQALAYIQQQGVRHKDIKPRNILIDDSGSVVVTDFGISKYFAPDVSHVTDDDLYYDAKYASPEMLHRVPRGDPSDVFSLGCVFLEMATLLLGETLKDLDEHYLDKTTDSSQCVDDGYCSYPDRVHGWIKHLGDLQGDGAAETEDGRSTTGDLKYQELTSHRAPWNQKLIATLPKIGSMMAMESGERPKTADLWSHFQHITTERCRDCDPRHPEVWKPTLAQEAAANVGLKKRRSLAQSLDESIRDRRSRRGSSSSPSRRLGKMKDLSSFPSRPTSLARKSPDKHENEVLVESLTSDRRGQSNPPIQSYQAVVEDPESLSKLVPAVTLNPPQQSLGHQHRRRSSDAIHYDKRESTAKDLVISEPDRLLHRPPNGRAITPDRELMHSAAKVTTESLTHASPETVDKSRDVLIYNYEEKKSCFVPFYLLKGFQYTKHPIPNFGRRIDLYDERGDVIANINLHGGLLLSLRRAFGQCPDIYLINRPSH